MTPPRKGDEHEPEPERDHRRKGRRGPRRRLLRILDGYVLRFFASSYAIATETFLTLFVIVDIFDRLDTFLDHKDPLAVAILRYYGAQLPVIFYQLGPFLTLAGAMFAVARLRRNNELLAMKAGGVSVWRTLVPIFVAGTAIAGAGVADQELLIPRLAEEIRAGTALKRKPYIEPGILRDREGSTLYAARYFPAARVLERVSFRTFREGPAGADAGSHAGTDTSGGGLRESRVLFAEKATWVQTGRRRGHWLFEDGAALELSASGERIAERPIGSGEAGGLKVKTSIYPIDVESVVQEWSTLTFEELRDQAYKRQSYLPHLRVLVHGRFAGPLAHLVLLLLGLPFVLAEGAVGGRSGRVAARVGALALVAICASFFVLTFIFADLGARGAIPPAAAAWVPVVLYGVGGAWLMAGVRT